MEIKIKWHDDMWQEIKDCTMTTISKDTGIYPTEEWKRKLLMCEHSPIRSGRIIVKFYEIPSYVATHFARHHVGLEKYISTRRSDRGFKDEVITRDTPVDMTMDLNFHAIMNISKKRLCTGADAKTIFIWKAFLDVIAEVEPALRQHCVVECIYRNGLCPEFHSCGYNKTKKFEKELKEYLSQHKHQINDKTSIFISEEKRRGIKMTHRTEVMTTNPMTINDKLDFVSALKAAKKIIVNDVVSLEDVSDIKIEFTTEDGDTGYMRLMNDYLHVETNKKFANLTAIRTFIETHFDTIPDGEDRPLPPVTPEA